mmetsp:Transcript_24908/g.62279  ORF Transcript_24908/g.62279 Transcript_24908/m.62279 type:complete len:432 (+) Transcript_24908:105-1400(+)
MSPLLVGRVPKNKNRNPDSKSNSESRDSKYLSQFVFMGNKIVSRPKRYYHSKAATCWVTTPSPAHLRLRSNSALREHRICDLLESRAIRAHHEISLAAQLLRGVPAVLVNARHDRVQPVRDLLLGPRQSRRVLRHLKTRHRDAAGVAGLARREADGVGGVDLDGGEVGRHVSALDDVLHAVLCHVLRVDLADLVLRRARERHVRGDVPQRVGVRGGVGGREGGAGKLLGVLRDAAAADVLEVHEERELVGGDPGGVVDEAGRVGNREHDGAELEQLLDGVLRDVSGAGHEASLALVVLARGAQHLPAENHRAVSGGLRADQRPAVLDTLAGEGAAPLAREALVLAEEVADLAAADADVAGGDVGGGGWSAVMKDWQKRMTSASDLPFGSKSAPPLPPPSGSVVSEFLRICSKPRNLRMERFTLGCRRRPPL